MKTFALLITLGMLTGCSVVPVEVGDTSFALLENPVSHKCVYLKMGKGKAEVGGVASWFSNLVLEGEEVEYHSYGEMCENFPEEPVVGAGEEPE